MANPTIRKILPWCRMILHFIDIFISSCLESIFVKDIIAASNKAYLNGETYARDFIQGLDAKNTIRNNGWKILLESATGEDLRRLKNLLDSETNKLPFKSFN